jgi:hypothetical protein
VALLLAGEAPVATEVNLNAVATVALLLEVLAVQVQQQY